ncbi:MAG: hypothetical protein R3E26_03265 [Nitrosomonas sp.]
MLISTAGGRDDYADIRDRGLIAIHAEAASDFILGNSGGDGDH